MSIQTDKARDVRIQKLIRSNRDAKRLYDENIDLRIRIAELEKAPSKKRSKAKRKD
jgi:hypothetical protein